MSEENLLIVEWHIENFCSWNKDLHEDCIESPESALISNQTFNAELVVCCPDDGLVKALIVDTEFDFTGELWFIAADGSVLATQQVQYHQQDESDFLPGPRHSDVVDLVKKNGSRDLLTLRFKFTKYPGFEVYTMFTTIDVRKVSLTIDQSLIGSILKSPPRKRIFSDESIVLEAASTKPLLLHTHLQLLVKTRRGKIRDPFFVEAIIRVVSKNQQIKMRKECNLFNKSRSHQAWKVAKFDTKDVEKDVIIILSFEIVQPELIEYSYSKCYFDYGFNIVPSKHTLPTSVFPENSLGVLSRDYMSVFLPKENSDFVLKCGNDSFPVHKAILSARSPVFKKMLSSGMIEEDCDEAVIEDIDTPTLALFLSFIYYGSVEDLDYDAALKLYHAADKYLVHTLKNECVDFLSANLSISNVCDVVVFSERHQDDELLKACHSFILDNYKAVMKSKEWENFIERGPFLGVLTFLQRC